MQGSDRIWSRKSFPKGTVIFRQGDAASTAYLIEEGEVELFVGDNDDRYVLDTLGPNGLFGELALIDKGLRSATAVAKSELTCLILHEQDLDRVLDRADPFLLKLMRVLSKRVRSTNKIAAERAEPKAAAEIAIAA